MITTRDVRSHDRPDLPVAERIGKQATVLDGRVEGVSRTNNIFSKYALNVYGVDQIM